MNTNATTGVRRDAHRPKATVLVGVLAAALLVLLPNAAQADHGLGGTRVGSAKISVTPDGYEATGSFFKQKATVSGIAFAPNNVAHIFQCPADVDPLQILVRCQSLGGAPTDSAGAFGPTDVIYSNVFVSLLPDPNKPVVVPTPTQPTNPVSFCRGFADWHVQCSIVAATFSPNGVPDAMAEHLICYEGGYEFANCAPRPTT